jgi:hypothetical protein
MKSTIIDEHFDKNLKKTTIDNSYMAYKLRKREISPIPGGGNTSKLQTSTNNFNTRNEIHKSLLKSTISPDKDGVGKVPKVEKKLDYKKVIVDSKMTKSLKSLPLKFLNEALKTTKNLTNFPERYVKNNSQTKKK